MMMMMIFLFAYAFTLFIGGKQLMSEKNLDKLEKNESVEEKRKRRTRNDEDGRNFTCHCGKSYLSYPALYTHVKTKHGGKS